MKKKWIPLLVCLALAVSLTFAACGGGDSFTKISVSGKQDTTYTVHGNGGMAVQYGNYVYFINGYAGYDDTDGKQNTWPNVVKGGLYRAELSGEKGENGEFTLGYTAGAHTDGLQFVADEVEDGAGEKADAVKVQRIAPKRIGTNGYANGGIFLYDDWVYFASPNNEKSKAGTVQSTLTDFFRARLDGSDVQKIYTTAKASDSSPYAFYKYNGAVYLVVQDGTDLVSVRVAKKAGDKVTIAKDVTSVLLPYSETYYKGMNENTLDHFVYVLRAATDKDTQNVGNVIELMRPDGKEGGVYHSQGKSDTLEAVRDGMLFYRTTDDSNNTRINYDTLHDFLMNEEKDISPSYRAYQNELASYVDAKGNFKAGVTDAQKKAYIEGACRQISGNILTTSSVSDYTSTYCFRPSGTHSDLVYMLGVKSAAVELRSNLPLENGLLAATISDETMSAIACVQGAYVYYKGSDSILYRLRWNVTSTDDNEKQAIGDGELTASPFVADYCAGYIVYFGDWNSFSGDYTLFHKADGPEGAEPFRIGKTIAADVLAAPEISIKKGEITWDSVTGADYYDVYYSTDSEHAVLAQRGLTTTSYTVGETVRGNYTYWVVSRAEDVISAKSNTVTYKA